jgi:hypothetical protein
MFGDGPTLEEKSLWDELADAYAENHQLAADLAAARTENAQLRAQLATRHRPTTRRPARVG